MTDPIDCATYLEALRREVDAALARALPTNAPSIVLDAMRYGLLGGGKRLRPCLTLATAEAVAARDGHNAAHARALALPAACAIELVHSYSLMHDDLPAMDDDALRRGRPTTHVVYGDGMAVLAGDGLLTEAFGLLSYGAARVHAVSTSIATPARRLHAIGVLAEAAGALGMVGGQAIDLLAAGRVISQPPEALNASALHDMHARKTGALIRAAATMGAILADADEATIAAIDRYAADVGLAFQIVDDILDVEGSAAELGKTAGKDADAGKPTYPALFGLDESRRLATECVERAKRTLDVASLHGRLGDIADWSLGRKH